MMGFLDPMPFFFCSRGTIIKYIGRRTSGNPKKMNALENTLLPLKEKQKKTIT